MNEAQCNGEVGGDGVVVGAGDGVVVVAGVV